jgi:hypothetical protein
MNIWVKGVAEPFAQAKRLTAETKRPIPAFFWSRDSKYILFVQDQGGDENFNVYAVNPADAPDATTQVPKARNVTEAKNARAHDLRRAAPQPRRHLCGPQRSRRRVARPLRGEDLDRRAKLLRKNTDKIAGWVMDRAGKPRLALRTADNGDTEILKVTDAGFEKVYSCTVFETCGPLQFHTDNARVYMETNHGDADLTAPGALQPGYEAGGGRRVGSAEGRWTSARDLLGEDRRARRHELRRRSDAHVFPRQVV